MQSDVRTVGVIDQAVEILVRFLEGMPEIGVLDKFPSELEIVNMCFQGDHHAYLIDSFSNFVMQCVENGGEE